MAGVKGCVGGRRITIAKAAPIGNKSPIAHDISSVSC
jgi:hypothetical protein